MLPSTSSEKLKAVAFSYSLFPQTNILCKKWEMVFTYYNCLILSLILNDFVQFLFYAIQANSGCILIIGKITEINNVNTVFCLYGIFSFICNQKATGANAVSETTPIYPLLHRLHNVIKHGHGPSDFLFFNSVSLKTLFLFRKCLDVFINLFALSHTFFYSNWIHFEM